MRPSSPALCAAQDVSDAVLTVDDPALAGRPSPPAPSSIRHPSVTSIVVGGGKRFFPDGVRLDLELVEQRAFDRLVYTGTDPLTPPPLSRAAP